MNKYEPKLSFDVEYFSNFSGSENSANLVKSQKISYKNVLQEFGRNIQDYFFVSCQDSCLDYCIDS